MKFGKIGVLMGGISSEREISLRSGTAVYQALKSLGHDATAIDVSGNIRKDLEGEKIDVAFIALHGRFGEDGTVQSMLEEMKIPYTGSGVLASKLALNKVESRKIFEMQGIPVPEYKVFFKGSPRTEGIFFPCVVKPAHEGSSIGLSIVDDKVLLEPALEEAYKYDDRVIIEKYIEGKEVTVGVLDEKALPVVRIMPTRKFFDYQAKYQKGLTEYQVPAQISKSEYKAAQAAGVMAHNALGCKSFSRTDIIIGNDGTAYVLEVNTIPGMTQTSLLPKAAKAAGIEFPQLCQRLVELAYKKEQK